MASEWSKHGVLEVVCPGDARHAGHGALAGQVVDGQAVVVLGGLGKGLLLGGGAGPERLWDWDWPLRLRAVTVRALPRP